MKEKYTKLLSLLMMCGMIGGFAFALRRDSNDRFQRNQDQITNLELKIEQIETNCPHRERHK